MADAALSAAERDELARLRREVRQLRVERDIPGVSRSEIASLERRPGLPARPARSRPGLPVHERQPGPLPDCHDSLPPGLTRWARVLGVAKAGYYAWLHCPPSAHARADAALLERIRAVHAGSREAYGAPRVHAALRAGGERHSRKRVERLMRGPTHALDGLAGASHRRGGPVTTRKDLGASEARRLDARPAPDLVDRDFTASGPNRLWVSDITFIPSATGFLYLAVVLDAWSRRVVGWSMANHLRTDPRT